LFIQDDLWAKDPSLRRDLSLKLRMTESEPLLLSPEEAENVKGSADRKLPFSA
jgi:hypothetical protein